MTKSKRTGGQTTIYTRIYTEKNRLNNKNPTENRWEFRCSGRVGSSCFFSGTLCVTPVTNPVIIHKCYSMNVKVTPHSTMFHLYSQSFLLVEGTEVVHRTHWLDASHWHILSHILSCINVHVNQVHITYIFIRLGPKCRGPSLSWSYGIYIYNYLCNRCL